MHYFLTVPRYPRDRTFIVPGSVSWLPRGFPTCWGTRRSNVFLTAPNDD